MPEPRRPGVTRVALVALMLTVAVALLLTPAGGDARGALTSTSGAPGGALLLHDMQERLGWRVERMREPIGGELATGAVYALLDPPVMLTSGEVHTLLDAVRAGAGLLVVVPPLGAPLADSLGIARGAPGGEVERADEAAPGFCADSLNRMGLIRWPGGRVQSWWLRSTLRPTVVFTRVRADTGASTATARTITTADGGTIVSGRGREPRPVPAMAGYTFGRGRVVAVADADLLRNDVLRVCRWNAGPTASRALEWLATDAGRRLVFAEYYQDPAVEASPARAIWRALLDEPWGRMLLALSAAGLVLIAATGVRPVPPLPRERMRRRSPLEHVHALARAYERAGATRVVARRLVRGLRRRHSPALSAGGAPGDDERLHALAARYPSIAPDLAFLEKAMAQPIPAGEVTRLGDAAARVDAGIAPRPLPER